MLALLLVALPIVVGQSASERMLRTDSPEASAVKYLLSRGYDSSIRPVPNERMTTDLNISINSFSLYQMDQVREVVEFSAEFILTWNDPFMTWDRKQFNVTWIKMKEIYIWKPDILVSTSIKTEFLLNEDERYVDLKYDGTIRQSYYGVFFNQCKMKVNCFPYDSQVCAVEIGPWSYTKAQVHSFPGEPILEAQDNFKGNSEWEFISMIAEAFDETDDDVGFNYTAIRWQTMLKRKPQFYFWVLLVPSFIITTVSLFGIFIPTNHLGDREEKVTLGLTTLLSTAVILEIVASTMPKASALPLLGNFILAEIFITAIGVLCSVAVLMVHHRAITRKWLPPMGLVRFCEFPFKSVSRRFPNGFLRRSSRSQPPPYPDEKKSPLVSELEGMLQRVDEWLEEEEMEAEREIAWSAIFDRLDMALVIIFQTANVIMTLTIT